MLDPDSLKELERGGDPWTGCGDVAGEWRRACTLFGGREAVGWSEGGWSYAELGQRIEVVANRLRRAGVRRGDRVGVYCLERRYWPLAMLAVATVGGIYLPLDRRLPEGRLRSMVEDAGVIVVVGDDEASASVFACRWVGVKGDGEAGKQAAEEGGTFALLYTSGTTGSPKGVMIEHAGVLNEAMAIGRRVGLGPGERALQFASPGFDASLEEMLSCLLSGAALVPRSDEALESFDGFQGFVAQQKLTVLNLPTAFWASWCNWMVEASQVVPSTVRAVVVGGERLSSRAVDDWMCCGGRLRILLNTYGPTEASIVSTAQLIDGGWSEAGDPPIGRPLEGCRVRVVDESGSRVGEGVWGDLWLGGIGVSPGYWGIDEGSSSAFMELDGVRWYRTGDVVKWDSEGRLLFGGRKDEQLKILGHRVEPEEVMRVLETHPRVASSHVAGVETAGGLVLAAWVKWVGDLPEAWTSELGDYLRVRLGDASVPVRWARVDEFKLTERGKLDPSALPKPKVYGRRVMVPPETDTEIHLSKLWQELLGVDEVGKTDDFFDLGGTSLAALRLFGRIAKDLGVRLPMAELMRASTLEALSLLVEEGTSVDEVSGEPLVVAMRDGGERGPLFCVHGGDGGVLFYRELAELLPEGLPLFTIESPVLSLEGKVEGSSIEEMAEHYLAAVRKKQSQGPYYLAGYSFGGVMVYEMARRLLEEGEEVAFLGLLDTDNPASRFRRYLASERLEVHWRANAGFEWWTRLGLLLSRGLEGVATNLRVKSEKRAVAEAGHTEPHSRLRMLQVREIHSDAMDVYVPQPLDLRMVLFKTEESDDKFDVPEDYGWRALVSELEIVVVPGAHLTMFESKNIVGLAERVSQHL